MKPSRTDSPNKMSRRKTFLLVFGVLGVVLFSYVLLQMRPVKVIVSPSTTYITQPLDEDGLPDYVAYLHNEMMRDVTPENNGAVPFWKAMGSKAIDPEHRAWYFQALGMEIPPERETRFAITDAAIEAFQKAHEAKNQPVDGVIDDAENLLQAPWRPSDLPGLAQWVEDEAEAYDLLAEAARRPRLAFSAQNARGETSLIQLMLSHLTILRSANRTLSGRAMLRIGEQKFDEAWTDCQTMFLLSSNMESHTLIGWLVAMALRQQAAQTTAFLVESDTDANRIREVEKFVASLPPFEPIGPILNKSERLMFLNAVVDLSRNRLSGSELMSGRTLSTTGVDWNHVLRHANKAYDGYIEALSENDRGKRDAAIEKWNAQFLEPAKERTVFDSAMRMATRSGRSQQCADAFIAMMMPAIQQAADARHRLDSAEFLFRLRARLNAHRCEHGEFPESLDALAGIGSMQSTSGDVVDPANQKPLTYERTDNGFLLYSFGLNATDDEGCSQRPAPLYRGVEPDKAAQLLSEPELLSLEKKLQVKRTQWDDKHVEALAVGDDITARSPLYVTPAAGEPEQAK